MSMAGLSSPLFQLRELALTPNPSMVWKTCAPSIVSDLPVALETVTITAVDVAALPAASRARAVSVCAPFGDEVVFHMIEYGAVEASAPIGASSTRSVTPATATLSEASTIAVSEPPTTAPFDGLTMDTAGGMTSGAGVENVKSPDRARLPAASLETTR